MRRLVTIAALTLAAQSAGAGPFHRIVKHQGVQPAILLLDCALSSDLTCSTGETLTFTRSTVGATCMTTGLDEHTLVTEPAVNTACFNDVHGIRVVGAIKNELCGTETFNDSVCDWLAVTDPAGITLDTDDSPLSGVDTLADTIDDDSAISAERVRQSFATTTAGKYRMSVWLRAASAHGATLEILNDEAVSPDTTTCDVNVLTTWKRFDCMVDSQGTFANITARIYPADSSAVSNTGAVFAWGAQVIGPATAGSKGDFLVPYCRSTGASSTTCTAELLTVAASEMKQTGGTLAVDYTPFFNAGAGPNGSETKYAVTGGNGILFLTVGNISTNDGTTTTSIATGTWADLVTRRIGASWLGGTKTARNITALTTSSGAYDGSYNADLIRIGGTSGSERAWAYLKHLQIYSKPTTRPPSFTALLDCSLVSDLTCASGDTLTFTRSTVGALCPSTGDEDTAVTEPAVDTACHHPTYGVRVVGAVKNELARSEDVCNAAWSTQGTVTCTADQADSPLSGVDVLADLISASQGSNSRFQTVSTTTTGSYRWSAWMCRERADANPAIGVEVIGGTGSNTVAQSSLSLCADGFDRVSLAITVGGAVTAVQPNVYPNWTGAHTGSAYIHVWGAQLQGPASGEAGKFLAPYCRSTGASATTCTAESLEVSGTGNFKQGGGTMSADATPLWAWNASTGPEMRLFVVGDGSGGETGGLLLYRAIDDAALYSLDGTTSAGIAPTGAALTTKAISTSWRNTRRRISADTTTTTSAHDGQWAGEATPTKMYLGSRGVTPQRGWAYFKSWRVYEDASPIP